MEYLCLHDKEANVNVLNRRHQFVCPSNRRVSMGLTNSRKTAKRLTVSRKKVNCIKIPGDSNGMI